MDRLARALSLFAVAVVFAVSAWPALVHGFALPVWAEIAPATRVLLLLLATAQFLAAGIEAAFARRLAIGALILGLLSGGAWLITAFTHEPADAASLLTRWLALRPPALVTAGVCLLAGALATRDGESEDFDFSVLLGSGAACAFFLLCIAHLYGADALTLSAPQLGAASGVLDAALLFALALVTMADHPGTPFAAYEGDGPGPVAKRRMLPAAVLTPLGSGFLMLYGVTGQQLSPMVAVTLGVFTNVLVMLLLVNGAGNTAEQVAALRQKRADARAAQARKQGMRDPMTGLLNRRGWDAEVQAGERRCQAGHLNACVVVIDLDGLKQVNDSEGHAAGDVFIKQAGVALRAAARQGDALARVGGDEFAYLVVDCHATAARGVVARFEQALRDQDVPASVGFAMRDQRSIQDAFNEADQAMYRAKRERKLRRA